MVTAPYSIEYAEGVAEDLAALRAFERKRILDAVQKQLSDDPDRQTRNKKILVSLVPPWEHIEPVWELRTREYRVFYDIDGPAHTVTVRAIRRKPPHKTTEEIL